MTDLEKGVLNGLECCEAIRKFLHNDSHKYDVSNGFTVETTKDRVKLWDSDILVADFDRGYLLLSQIVPLIAEVIEPCPDTQKN